MRDDIDLDLDDDLGDLDLPKSPSATTGKSAAQQPQKAAEGTKPADSAQKAGASGEKKTETTKPAEKSPGASQVKATVGRRPNHLQRAGEKVSGVFANIKLPQWTFRNFIIILVVLVALIIFFDNWAPVRISFFGFRFELPKAVAFILNAALGAVVTWLWMRRTNNTPAEKAQ